MGRVIVDRENSFAGIAAFYNIYLDGKLIDRINNGEVKEYIVSNGTHEIYIQNGVLSFGFKSNIVTFNVQDDNLVRVYCNAKLSKMSGIELKVVYNKTPVVQSSDKYKQLEKIADLKNKGILSEEEFEMEKNKILEGDV